MKKINRILRSGTLLAAFAVAACASPINGPEAVFDVRTAHPINVAPQMETLHVPANAVAGGLSPEMNSRLTAFAKDYLADGNGAISVSVPAGDVEARNYFATRLSQFGIPAWRMLIGSDTSSSDVEISYIRYSAEAPACGDWSSNVANTASNRASANFGCASQHNLAVMVADPRDLVSPHEMEAADAQRRMTVLDKYRKGEPTGSQKTQEQSGAVSDIGK
jgi:pilus assembly protein CpaD